MTAIQTESGPPEPWVEYSLRPRNPGDHSSALRVLFSVLLVVVAVFTVVVAANAYGGVPAGGIRNGQTVVLLLICGIGLALILYVVLALGPGAVQCVWNSDGFVLVYEGGRRRVFAWESPSFRVSLVKYEERNGTRTFEINQGVPIHNPLSAELYGAILAEAHRRKFTVRTQASHLMSGEMVTQVITPPTGRAPSTAS